MSDEQHDNYFSIMEAARIVDMAELSVYAHAVVLTIAGKDDNFLAAMREFAAAAHRAGYRDATQDIATVKDGIAFYRDDGSLVVTVSVGDLAERGMPDADVIGVCWGPGEDTCLDHALTYADKQARHEADERGALIYAGQEMRCFVCRGLGVK
ncbi:MAG: hypothetical protein ACRD03_03905 [Acidimicrobiales bacterium]